MFRYALVLLPMLASLVPARAEVLMNFQGTSNGTASVGNNFDFSAGVTFNVSGSSAGSGRWQLTNVKFLVGADTSTYTLTGARVSLFMDSGSGTYVRQGSENVSFSSGNVGAGSASTQINLQLSANSLWGIAGNESSGLAAGNYLLGIDNFSGTGDFLADGYFVSSNTASSGPSFGPAASWMGTVDNSAGGYRWPDAANVTTAQLNDFSTGRSVFSGNFYTQIEGAAVPEPGTLILGGIAAVSGGAGAWWRRRKNRKATAEQAA